MELQKVNFAKGGEIAPQNYKDCQKRKSPGFDGAKQ